MGKRIVKFCAETRSYGVGCTYSARRRNSLTVGVSTSLTVTSTRSRALGFLRHAPLRRFLMPSSPSFDRSGGRARNLGPGQNQSSEISNETHCWTQKARK
jgi:hypothetical protein